jgi:hypothetical protein
MLIAETSVIQKTEDKAQALFQARKGAAHRINSKSAHRHKSRSTITAQTLNSYSRSESLQRPHNDDVKLLKI